MSLTSANAGAHQTDPPALPVPAFRFGGLELTPITAPNAVDWVLHCAQRGRPAVVVTSHIFHVMTASRKPDFRRAVGSADLNVADGWPLVVASRLLRPALPNRVPGIDLVSDVLSAGVRLRVAILGGPGDSATRLGELLRVSHDIVLTDGLPKGVWAGEEAMSELEVRLQRAMPNLTLVGLGVPHQELLAPRLRPFVSGPIIACGATIEVLAGDRRRAPRLMRRVGLEWAFRVAMEPQRLGGRYARASVWFGVIAVRETIGRVRRADSHG